MGNIPQRTIIRAQDDKQRAKVVIRVINFDNTPGGRILIKSKDKHLPVEGVVPFDQPLNKFNVKKEMLLPAVCDLPKLHRLQILINRCCQRRGSRLPIHKWPYFIQKVRIQSNFMKGPRRSLIKSVFLRCVGSNSQGRNIFHSQGKVFN